VEKRKKALYHVENDGRIRMHRGRTYIYCQECRCTDYIPSSIYCDLLYIAGRIPYMDDILLYISNRYLYM
jgi:hypothetical protein